MKKRAEMRKEQGNRLKEIMAKRREEKKKELEDELIDLENIVLERKGDDLKEVLASKGYKNVDEANKRISVLQVKLNKNTNPLESNEDKYNLLNIPDEELLPDQIKQKRIQKMQKTA